MEKKKLNIKVKIAVGIIIFIVVLFIGSFVYYKQGIKATSSKNKEVIVTTTFRNRRRSLPYF